MSEESRARRGCTRVRGRLERLLDDGLPPLEAALDRGHLEACASCRAEAGTWRDLLDDVRRASRAPAPESQRAVERVLATLPSPCEVRTAPRWPLAAAAAGLLCALVWWGGGKHALAQVRVDVGSGFSGALEALPTWAEMSAGFQQFTRRLS